MRRFGTEISGNRGPGCELSSEQRVYAIAQYEAGVPAAQIADALRCAKSTIYATINRARELHSVKSRPRSGQPAKLTDRDKRHAYTIARRHPRMRYSELQETAGLDVHPRTIARALHERNIYKRLAVKKFKLTEDHARQRLEFAYKYRHWKAEDWHKVLFSDECSVERGTGRVRLWVFRKPNEKFRAPGMIDEVKKGKDLSQMFWAAVWGTGERTELVMMERDNLGARLGYTRNSYIWALEEGLIPVYEPGQIFQQDNAPIHTAEDVKEWLERHGIWVLEWPPYSPDLNPIEHIWWRLKQKVFELYPELERQGASEEALNNLRSACKEAWRLIGRELIKAVVDSMPRRIEAVIKAIGWQTKY